MPRESKFAEEDDVQEESKFGDGLDNSESKFGDSKAGKLESKSANDSEVDQIMKRASHYCFSPEFIGVFEKYIRENAYIFYDTVDSGEDEHKLEYHDLFKEYLELYESTMENWLERENITLADFNKTLQVAKEQGRSNHTYFIRLLVASGECKLEQ